MNADGAFWARVDKSGDCWTWTGAKTRKGYGQLRHEGKTIYAHRFVLARAGVDIDGKQVDHICHRPECVRPDHLRCATNKQNSENLTGAYTNSKSGVRGVWYEKRTGLWYATVGHQGKQHRKRFPTVEAAAEWARLKRLELFTHSDSDRVSA